MKTESKINEGTKNMVETRPSSLSRYFFPEFINEDGSKGKSIEAESSEAAEKILQSLEKSN